jgi:hypothetical protein
MDNNRPSSVLKISLNVKNDPLRFVPHIIKGFIGCKIVDGEIVDQYLKKYWIKKRCLKIFLDTTFMENIFGFCAKPVFWFIFDLPLRIFCLKTSLFHQIHPPIFHFSGSTTHKLTFKTKIGQLTCILVIFWSCEKKFMDKLSPNSKIFQFNPIFTCFFTRIIIHVDVYWHATSNLMFLCWSIEVKYAALKFMLMLYLCYISDFVYWDHNPSNKTPAIVIHDKKFKNAPTKYPLRTFVENLFLMSPFRTDVNFQILIFIENKVFPKKMSACVEW